MRPNQANVLTGEGEPDEGARRLGRIATPLSAWHDAVGDLDHAGVVRRALESRAADHPAALAIDHEEPVAPYVRAMRIPQGREPIGGDLIRYVKRPQVIGPTQTQQVLEAFRVIDQRKQVLR